jgi:NTP pyrophosphatase (non-canonical NTP hydrolase)
MSEGEEQGYGMTLNEYQLLALRTAGAFPTSEEALKCWALGVAGEGGEFADAVKKALYHGHGVDRAKLAKEIGDGLWYYAVAAHALGYSLSEVAQMNVEKLRARYPDGFDPERSKNRRE